MDYSKIGMQLYAADQLIAETKASVNGFYFLPVDSLFSNRNTVCNVDHYGNVSEHFVIRIVAPENWSFQQYEIRIDPNPNSIHACHGATNFVFQGITMYGYFRNIDESVNVSLSKVALSMTDVVQRTKSNDNEFSFKYVFPGTYVIRGITLDGKVKVHVVEFDQETEHLRINAT